MGVHIYGLILIFKRRVWRNVFPLNTSLMPRLEGAYLLSMYVLWNKVVLTKMADLYYVPL